MGVFTTIYLLMLEIPKSLWLTVVLIMLNVWKMCVQASKMSLKWKHTFLGSKKTISKA